MSLGGSQVWKSLCPGQWPALPFSEGNLENSGFPGLHPSGAHGHVRAPVVGEALDAGPQVGRGGGTRQQTSGGPSPAFQGSVQWTAGFWAGEDPGSFVGRAGWHKRRDSGPGGRLSWRCGPRGQATAGAPGAAQALRLLTARGCQRSLGGPRCSTVEGSYTPSAQLVVMVPTKRHIGSHTRTES